VWLLPHLGLLHLCCASCKLLCLLALFVCRPLQVSQAGLPVPASLLCCKLGSFKPFRRNSIKITACFGQISPDWPPKPRNSDLGRANGNCCAQARCLLGSKRVCEALL
jgi:hypothetical protein